MDQCKTAIDQADTNQEKGITYKAFFDRYNKAKKAGYYLECLWILYAMLEDRTSAFLYYIGCTDNNNRLKVTGTKYVKFFLRDIFNMTKTSRYEFDTMHGKLKRIQQVIEWARKGETDGSSYQRKLLEIISKANEKPDFSAAIRYLDNTWRDKRNQLVHKLFKKNVNSAVSELESLVEEGYNALRAFGIGVKRVKRFEVRKKFKIA